MQNILRSLLVLLILVLGSCSFFDLFSDDGIVSVDSNQGLNSYLTFKAKIDYTKMGPDVEDSLKDVRPVLLWHVVGTFTHYYAQNITDYTIDSTGMYHFDFRNSPVPEILTSQGTAVGKLWFFENKNGSGEFTSNDFYHSEIEKLVDSILTVEAEMLVELNSLKEFAIVYDIPFDISQAECHFFFNSQSDIYWQEHNGRKDTIYNSQTFYFNPDLHTWGLIEPETIFNVLIDEYFGLLQNNNRYESFVYQRGYSPMSSIETIVVNDSVVKYVFNGEKGRIHPDLQFSEAYSKQKKVVLSKRLQINFLKKELYYKRQHALVPHENFPLTRERENQNWLVGMCYEYFFLFIDSPDQLQVVTESVNKGAMTIETDKLHTGYNVFYGWRFARNFHGITQEELDFDSILNVEHGQNWRDYQPDVNAVDPGIDQSFDISTLAPLVGTYRVEGKNYVAALYTVENEFWLYLSPELATFLEIYDFGLLKLVPTINSGTFKSPQFNNLIVTVRGQELYISFHELDKSVLVKSETPVPHEEDLLKRIQITQGYQYQVSEVSMDFYRGAYTYSYDMAVNISPNYSLYHTPGIFPNNILQYAITHENYNGGQSLTFPLYPIGNNQFYNPDIAMSVNFNKYDDGFYYKTEVTDYSGTRSWYNRDYIPKTASTVQNVPTVIANNSVSNNEGVQNPNIALIPCSSILQSGSGVVTSVSNDSVESWYIDDSDDFIEFTFNVPAGLYHLTIQACSESSIVPTYFSIFGGDASGPLVEIQEETSITFNHSIITIDAIIVKDSPYRIKVSPVNTLGYMPKIAFDLYALKKQ